MEDQKNDHKGPDVSILSLSSSSSPSDNLNSKYPYLTAYVGFIALFVLSGFAASLLFAIPQYMVVGGFSPFTELFTRILQLVLGFYVFRYIVIKHVLPYSSKP